MVGEEFYNKAHGKDIYSTSSTLKAVYEDMRQPAFASHHPQAKAIRKAFEKGLKLYGEERDLDELIGINMAPTIAYADHLLKNNFSIEDFHDKLDEVYRTIYYLE